MVQRWREWWGDDDTNGMQMLCGWHGDGILIPYEWNVDAVWVAWGWHPHTLGSIRERQQRPAALGDHAQVRVRGTSTHATMLAVGRPGYRALWRLFSLNTLARCSPLDAPLGAGGVDPGSEWAHLGWGQRRALHTILDGVRGMPCIKSDACPVSSQRHALYQANLLRTSSCRHACSLYLLTSRRTCPPGRCHPGRCHPGSRPCSQAFAVCSQQTFVSSRYAGCAPVHADLFGTFSPSADPPALPTVASSSWPIPDASPHALASPTARGTFLCHRRVSRPVWSTPSLQVLSPSLQVVSPSLQVPTPPWLLLPGSISSPSHPMLQGHLRLQREGPHSSTMHRHVAPMAWHFSSCLCFPCVPLLDEFFSDLK